MGVIVKYWYVAVNLISDMLMSYVTLWRQWAWRY
jgi:hypothetical protein